MNLVWLPAARRNLETIIRYIAERDTDAAQRLKSMVEDCAERLAEHPFMYRPGRVPGTREAVVHPNYILIYHVTADAVEIISLVHARQEYP
jgi:addiction module RelE/StbE family toxin